MLHHGELPNRDRRECAESAVAIYDGNGVPAL